MDQNEPPKMMFEGEEFQRPRPSFQTQTPKIVEWVIKYSGGLVKDERQAQYALVGFFIVAMIISIFLLSGGDSLGRSGKTPIPAGQNTPRTFSK